MVKYKRQFAFTLFAEVCLVVLPLLILGSIVVFFGTNFIEQNILLFFLFIAFYSIFAFIMFFYIPGKIMVFRPSQNVSLLSHIELFERINKTFSLKNNENKNLFEVSQKDNKILVTWSSQLNYNQLISYGVNKWKKVFILDCDEKKHIVKLSQKSATWNTGLTTGGFSFSGSYFRGLTMEFDFIAKPSFQINEDGAILFDVEKIRYSSNEIMQPLLETLVSSGWTVRASIL